MSGYNDLATIAIDDFSEMLVSEADPADVPLNGSPNTQNYYCLKAGELTPRDGYQIVTTPAVTGKIDGYKFFVDGQGGFHHAVWRAGNLYDWGNGASTLIASNVYAAGKRVCYAVADGILYFSDGETFYASGGDYVGIYTWDAGISAAAPMAYEPGVGRMPAPACRAMTIHNGSLVLGATRPYNSGVSALEPHMLRWSNPIIRSTFLMTDGFQVGMGLGTAINSLQPFSLSTEALSPASTLFVGKDEGIWGMKGALSELQETLIPCEDGVMDPASVRYVKTGDKSGVVIFLGTGKRCWITDGVSASDAIMDNIRSEFYDYISYRLLDYPEQVFSATLAFSIHHYLLDVGGRQYLLNWRTMKWTRFVGWPSGLWTEAQNANRSKLIYCAYADPATTTNYLALCNSGFDDNGTAIDAYWDTPDLKGGMGEGFANVGSLELFKRFVEFYLEFAATKAIISLTFTADRNESGADIGTETITIVDTSTVPRYDTGLTYDSGVLYGDSSASTRANYKRTVPIVKIDANSQRRGSVQGYCMRVRIRQNQLQGYAAIYAMQIKFQPRGGRRGRARLA